MKMMIPLLPDYLVPLYGLLCRTLSPLDDPSLRRLLRSRALSPLNDPSLVRLLLQAHSQVLSLGRLLRSRALPMLQAHSQVLL